MLPGLPQKTRSGAKIPTAIPVIIGPQRDVRKRRIEDTKRLLSLLISSGYTEKPITKELTGYWSEVVTEATL
jgi:hypothetical protein